MRLIIIKFIHYQFSENPIGSYKSCEVLMHIEMIDKSTLTT